MAVTEHPGGETARQGSGFWPSVWNAPASRWGFAAILLLIPAAAGDFWLLQVYGWTFALGIVALSLQFLGGYGGMVSLAQMTIAGFAGYMVAIFGTSSVEHISLGWPWWLNIPAAIFLAVIFGTITGALAVRTEGIYTIMITLAIAAAFFFFVNQDYVLFNGFSGFNSVLPPTLFGVDWREPTAYYYMTLFFAVLAYGVVLYVSRSPFGLALQGVRDNPRRMAALGFNVTAHRIAAYAFASVIAAVGGLLLVWSNAQVSPGTQSIDWVINILIIAVVGGMSRPIGPFIGAFIFVLLENWSETALAWVGLSPERFKLVIGLGFLAIVLWSRDGVLGIWESWRARSRRDPLTGRAPGDDA